MLRYDPDNIDAIIDKAETYLANEEYDEGMSLLFYRRATSKPWMNVIGIK